MNTSIKTIMNFDFSKYQDGFARQVDDYLKKSGMKQIELAKFLGEGIDEQKISKLINKSDSGAYGMRLMGHYLILFVMRRVVDVRSLNLGNKPAEALLKELATILEDEELIYIISAVKKMGRDPKSVLKPWYNDIKEISKKQ